MRVETFDLLIVIILIVLVGGWLVVGWLVLVVRPWRIRATVCMAHRD